MPHQNLPEILQLPEFDTKAAESAFLHQVWVQFQRDATLCGTTLANPESWSADEFVKLTSDFLQSLPSDTLAALLYRIDVPEQQILALAEAPDYWLHMSFLLLKRCAVKVMLRQSFSK